MDAADREKIEKIIHGRKLANGYYLKKSDVFRAFAAFEEKAFADGKLDKKSKELIAVGASIVINCESCMQWHIEQALKAGATEEQVLEAIGVGMEMGGGPATVSARFAMNVLEYYGNRQNNIDGY
jgi:AhpD family alkylhydroperoxidase